MTTRLRQTARQKPRQRLAPTRGGRRSQPDRSFKLVVGNATNEIRILDDDRIGALDATYGPSLNPDGGIFDLVPLPNGKLLVAGGFTELAGARTTAIARLNPDGSVDETFRTPEILASPIRMRGVQMESITSQTIKGACVTQMALESDGGILIAGGFSLADGRRRTSLARLHAEGTLDESFRPEFEIDGNIATILRQRDGKIVIGGSFDRVEGETSRSLARLNPDGSLDRSFSSNAVFHGTLVLFIAALAQDTQGRLLVGGIFEKVNGFPLTNIARLNPDGTRDTGFLLTNGASGLIARFATLPNGQVLVGGLFDTIGRTSYRKLARLNENGAVDRTFNPTLNLNGDVRDIIPLADGRVLVGGAFTRVGSGLSRYLTMLTRSGSRDSTFDAGAGPSDAVYRLAAHGNGSVWISGEFGSYNQQRASGLVRIHLPPQPPALSIFVEGSQARLEISGHAGDYKLLESGNLQDWTSGAQIVMTGPRSSVAVPIAAGKRFYKIELQQP